MTGSQYSANGSGGTAGTAYSSKYTGSGSGSGGKSGNTITLGGIQYTSSLSSTNGDPGFGGAGAIDDQTPADAAGIAGYNGAVRIYYV